MTEIWRKIDRIRKDRSNEMRKRMKAYDEEVFYPAIKAVQAECAAIGHSPGEAKWNGLGWNWRECRHCGARTEGWSDAEA